jgi:hypothetical protein
MIDKRVKKKKKKNNYTYGCLCDRDRSPNETISATKISYILRLPLLFNVIASFSSFFSLTRQHYTLAGGEKIRGIKMTNTNKSHMAGEERRWRWVSETGQSENDPFCQIDYLSLIKMSCTYIYIYIYINGR